MENQTLLEFIKSGIEKQKEYAKRFNVNDPSNLTDDEAHFYVNTFLNHMIEEIIEAKMLVPRKFWKQEKSYLQTEEGKREFCYELCDILLFFRSAILYSKIEPEVVLKHMNDKMNYNETRKDHNLKND